jgi:hypothetical protein
VWHSKHILPEVGVPLLDVCPPRCSFVPSFPILTYTGQRTRVEHTLLLRVAENGVEDDNPAELSPTPVVIVSCLVYVQADGGETHERGVRSMSVKSERRPQHTFPDTAAYAQQW